MRIKSAVGFVGARHWQFGISGEAMSNTNAAQEPSMEEILASIRRIISDEEAAIGEGETEAAAEPPESEEPADAEAEMSQDDLDALFDSPAEPEPEEEPAEDDMDDMAAAMADMEAEEPSEEEDEGDVLELAEEWQESDLVEPAEDDLAFMEEEPVPEPTPELEQAVHQTLEEKVPPILKATIETAPTPDGPLPALDRGVPLVSDEAGSKVTNAFGDLTHTVLSSNTRTMENVVEDMLRPMLKAWLDQNLPVMVERLVRAEIERVSRGDQHFR